MTTPQILTGVAIAAITVLCLATVGPNPAVVVVLVAVIAAYAADVTRSGRSRTHG